MREDREHLGRLLQGELLNRQQLHRPSPCDCLLEGEVNSARSCALHRLPELREVEQKQQEPELSTYSLNKSSSFLRRISRRQSLDYPQLSPLQLLYFLARPLKVPKPRLKLIHES